MELLLQVAHFTGGGRGPTVNLSENITILTDTVTLGSSKLNLHLLIMLKHKRILRNTLSIDRFKQNDKNMKISKQLSHICKITQLT